MLSWTPICTLIVSAALISHAYQPCPLLRAYYPPPTISKSSDAVITVSSQMTKLFDKLISQGSIDVFGAITPNSTSFSVVLFSGAETLIEDPTLFEYHHTAPLVDTQEQVTSETIFPLGTSTQVFTVYKWLVQKGDRDWGTPITEFLPELSVQTNSSTDSIAVDWEKITIGALAGQMSGISRDSHICVLNQACNLGVFANGFATVPPLFLPDTTPIISNAAFQILAFAMAKNAPNATDMRLDSAFRTTIFEPLNMTRSSFLDSKDKIEIFGQSLNLSEQGDPAALAMLSTTNDLARAGHAILSARLLDGASTRRWLQPTADTSNLRNGVGRPWEIYHAGQYANSSILDVYTKAGEIGQYASYFGISPDLNVGFAILAHDTLVTPDLNVYVDVVSLALDTLITSAAKETQVKYGGTFTLNNNSRAVFSISSDGPGLLVLELEIDGVDIRSIVADAAKIALSNLDFRVYPTNVMGGAGIQFVAVFQDKSATADNDTPTCITWQYVSSLGSAAPDRFTFQLDRSGAATAVKIAGHAAVLTKDTK